MPNPLIVLKFGGSVLTGDAGIHAAAREVQRRTDDGHAVLAVVSALYGETDQLLRRAREYSAAPQAAAQALLLATGELASAAYLGLALHARGVAADVLDAAAIGLATRGDPLDAEPISLRAAALRDALNRGASAVVVPGFVGRGENGHTTLLGRGGSDLTALFLAHHLGARCRLVKDVDGLYEWDPAKPGPAPRRYRTLGWRDALQLDGRIVQHKAVRWAQQRGLAFEVGAIGSEAPSLIGDHSPTFFEAHAEVSDAA